MDLVISFVTNLPAVSFNKLLSDVWTCQALFRTLPPMVKQIIGRLLYVSTAVSVSVIHSWFKSENVSAVDDALNRLLALHFMEGFNDQSSVSSIMPESVRFNDAVQKCLIQAFDGSLQIQQHDGWIPNKSIVSKFSEEKWEAILHFVVGSEIDMRPSPKIISILTSARLVHRNTDGSHNIGVFGFQFLLKNTNTQIWRILTAMASMSQNGLNVISFAFRLAMMPPGHTCAINDLPMDQRPFLSEFRELGLIFQSEAHPNLYCSTSLAQNLTQNDTQSDGYIVVESNNRMQYRLPNLAVGMLTKQSVSAAFDCDIAASEIIRFLREHSHPESGKHARKSVPPAICEQIKLWEAERSRVSMRGARMYRGFTSLELFKDAVQYAHDCGILLWAEGKSKLILVRREDSAIIDTYFERRGIYIDT